MRLDSYSYSFQGQEHDDEVKGKGNSINYKYRMHDPRIGRFFAVDPLASKYPHYSPYGFSGNHVINSIELEGLEDVEVYNKRPGEKSEWDRSYKMEGLNHDVNRVDHWSEKDSDGNRTLLYTEFKDLDGNSIIKYGSRDDINAAQINRLIENPKADQEEAVKIPTAVSAPVTYVSLELMYSSYVRRQYLRSASNLAPTDVVGRTKLKADVRERTPPIMRSFIEHNRPSVESKSGSTSSANKTNAAVNKWATRFGYIGKIGTGFSFASSGYNIYHSDDKPRTILRESAKTVVSIQGGSLGATVGMKWGPWGALFGGILGSIAGAEVTESVMGEPPSDFEIEQREQELIEELEREGAILWCFVAGTKIPMADGTTKNIEDIVIGDAVLSVNTKSLEVESDTVYEIMSPMHKNLFTISFEHTENTNTGDHPYYIQGKGWASLRPNKTLNRYGLNVEQLEIGDVGYFLVEGELINSKLIEINKLDTNSVKTYNIKVRKNKNYLANGILVHNKCCFKEGSMVSMKNGTLKPIENVTIGDSILSYNVSTGRYSNDAVTNISRKIHKELVRVEYSNGVIVTSTLDHPYYVKGKGWASFNPEKTLAEYNLEVSRLEEGDKCFHTDEDGNFSEVIIINIDEVNEVSKTFNLSGLSNGNTYFVNGILVTNER